MALKKIRTRNYGKKWKKKGQNLYKACLLIHNRNNN